MAQTRLRRGFYSHEKVTSSAIGGVRKDWHDTVRRARGTMLSFLGRGESSGKDAADMDAEPSTSDLSEASSVSITLEATLEGHTDRAWCVAWEPQGRFLATCSSDRTARLWAPSRAAGGAWVTVAELEGVHNRTVRSVAWSPCGTSARRADPRETYLFPFSPSRSLRVPAALRRFFRALETFCVSENETTD